MIIENFKRKLFTYQNKYNYFIHFLNETKLLVLKKQTKSRD